MLRKPDPKKEEQDRLQNILLDLLKEEDNKYCADCNAKTPRWASWNLGVFICIRCAGIHRNLGVHISKVRSVTLDSWTPEQVQSMRVMGNERGRKVYEHSLPEHFRRSLPDHQMEQFIRAKYDQKRYILQGFTYPRIDISELPKAGQNAPKKTPTPIVRPLGAAPVTTKAVPAPASASVNDLLDFSAPAAPAATKTNGASALIDTDLAGLSISSEPAPSSAAANDLDDMFGSFVGASDVKPTPAPEAGGDLVGLSLNTTNGNGLAGLTPSSTAIDDKRSTADIMSLFGSQPAPAAQLVAPGGFTAFGMQAAASHQPVAKTNSHDNSGLGSLQGLNFGMAPAPTSTMPQTMAPMGGMPPMGGMNTMGGAFPNPFGAPAAVPAPLFTSVPTAQPHAPSQQSPNSPSFSIPNKTNAFADLSLGKVMGMMGSKPSSNPTPPPATVPASTTPSAMNFDDLLGL